MAAVEILLSFLFGAVVIAILMHLHFKNAPDVRVALVSPPVYAVIGCLIGISVGMMLLWVNPMPAWEGRIFIEQGVASALIGAGCGGVAGIGPRALYQRNVRARIILVMLTVMLLGASVGVPIGWLYGDVSRPRGAFADEAVPSTQRGMMWGTAIGCSVGFALGLLELCFGGRQRKVDASAPTPEKALS